MTKEDERSSVDKAKEWHKMGKLLKQINRMLADISNMQEFKDNFTDKERDLILDSYDKLYRFMLIGERKCTYSKEAHEIIRWKFANAGDIFYGQELLERTPERLQEWKDKMATENINENWEELKEWYVPRGRPYKYKHK